MRLTKSIRDRILQLVLEDVRGNRIKDINGRRMKLANNVYDCIYGPYEKAIKALPPGALNTYSYIDVKFHSSSDCIYMGKNRPRFYNVPTEMRTLPADHKLTIEWQAIQKAKDELQTDTRKVSQEVNAILNSVTTDKRLLEVWPAGAHWIVKAIPEANTTTLPVVRIEAVNDLLCKLIGKNSTTCGE